MSENGLSDRPSRAGRSSPGRPGSSAGTSSGTWSTTAGASTRSSAIPRPRSPTASASTRSRPDRRPHRARRRAASRGVLPPRDRLPRRPRPGRHRADGHRERRVRHRACRGGEPGGRLRVREHGHRVAALRRPAVQPGIALRGDEAGVHGRSPLLPGGRGPARRDARAHRHLRPGRPAPEAAADPGQGRTRRDAAADDRRDAAHRPSPRRRRGARCSSRPRTVRPVRSTARPAATR